MLQHLTIELTEQTFLPFFMKVQEKTTNHKLTLAVSFLVERVQKHDGLNGLSETHLIGENRVGFLTVIEPQPVDTLLHK